MSRLRKIARRHGHLAILVAAGLMLLVYAWPGYMNYDASAQLIESRTGYITDYHPPLITVYWRFLEIFVEGPLLLLLVQLSLFLYGVYAILRLRLAPYPAAWITAGILLYPPVFTVLAMVWKDSQMAAFLVAGTALALRPGRVARVLGLLLLASVALVRFNGGSALPTLYFLAVVTTWGSRKRWLQLAATCALLVATVIAMVVVPNAITDRKEYNWYRTTAMFDIVGVACRSPIESDADFIRLMDGIGLEETEGLKQKFCDSWPPGKRNWFAYAAWFTWPPNKTERLARKRLWKHMVITYPGAWFEGRLLLAKDHLGLWDDAVKPWEPVGQDFYGTKDQGEILGIASTLNGFQKWSGDKLRWLANETPLYKPWIYGLASLLLFAWAIWRRNLLVGCIVGSGLAYQVSIFLFANAPDFRFSHWMIVCTLVGLALRHAKPAAQGDGAR